MSSSRSKSMNWPGVVKSGGILTDPAYLWFVGGTPLPCTVPVLVVVTGSGGMSLSFHLSWGLTRVGAGSGSFSASRSARTKGSKCASCSSSSLSSPSTPSLPSESTCSSGGGAFRFLAELLEFGGPGAEVDFSGCIQPARGAFMKQVFALCPLPPQRLQVFCLLGFPVIGVTFSRVTSGFA